MPAVPQNQKVENTNQLMNRRSFIRTITASGVSLFLPKVIQPFRWKQTRTNDFVEGEEAFKGRAEFIIVDNDSWKILGAHDGPFAISAFVPVNEPFVL